MHYFNPTAACCSFNFANLLQMQNPSRLYCTIRNRPEREFHWSTLTMNPTGPNHVRVRRGWIETTNRTEPRHRDDELDFLEARRVGFCGIWGCIGAGSSSDDARVDGGAQAHRIPRGYGVAVLGVVSAIGADERVRGGSPGTAPVARACEEASARGPLPFQPPQILTLPLSPPSDEESSHTHKQALNPFTTRRTRFAFLDVRTEGVNLRWCKY